MDVFICAESCALTWCENTTPNHITCFYYSVFDGNTDIPVLYQSSSGSCDNCQPVYIVNEEFLSVHISDQQ